MAQFKCVHDSTKERRETGTGVMSSAVRYANKKRADLFSRAVKTSETIMQ